MRFNHSPKLFLGLSLLILTVGVRAQNVIYTTTTTAAGNWDLTANWAGGLVGSGAGNTAVLGANGVTMTLDVPETLGIVKDSQGSSRTWTINASGTVAMTFDNTGNTANNPNGDLNAWLGSTSSGSMIFRPNIIIQNTDLEIEQSGSTTPSGAVGTLGTSTITATSARNLILIQNEAKAGEKVFVINSSIGGAGSSFITVSNVGPGSGTMDVTGIIGPNAGVVENSPVGSFTSNLELANGGNTYTGSTIITNGTLQLGAANTIPSVSVVYIYGAADNGSGILQMSGFSDVIDGLNGSGTVNTGAAGAQTLTMGGNNSGGSFSGIIENTAGTLSLTKTGTGTQVLSGANTYSGTTTLNGGILNAGIADSPGSSGPFGLATSVGSIVFGGGTLQYSNTVNNQDYSGRFSTAASQPISIDAAGSAVTFATALISSGGSLTLADSVGGGSLTLTAAETYSGNTTINGGSLVLGSGGSLANNSSVNIGAGGTLNVSAQASPYALGTSANFRASGTGITTTMAATLVPAAGGIFNLGTQPVSLTWSGAASGTDSTHPPLTVSQGTLQFNGNSITVVVPGTALGVGVYTLISASAAAISGAPSSVPLFGGNGLALGNTAAISVSGGNVILTVTLSPSTVGTWTGGAGSPFNWSASGNWSGGVPQSAGDSAIFGSAVTAVLLNTAESVGTLQFNNNSGAYTIAGSATLTLDNKGNGAAVKVTTAGANLVQPPVSLNDSSGNTTITVNSGDSLAISGNISSTSTNETLTIVNAGTNILSGANTYGPLAGYVGTTFSGGGVLQLGNSSALGAGDLSMPASSGTLQAGAAGLSVANNVIIGTGLTITANNNGYNLTLGGAISGGASLTAIGSGTLTLNGNNTYTGNTTVNAGVLSISSANNVASPAIVLNGGDLLGNGTFAEVNNIGIGSAAGPAGTNALIDAASGQTFTVSGVIATAGNGGVNSLTINSVTPSPGEVTLTGANTYNGTTVIANGTLDVANSLALQDSTLNYSSGTLVFDSSISAATFAGLTGTKNLSLANLSPGPVALTVGGNNANIYYNNIVDAGLGGSLIKTGTGTMVVTNATYTGNTTVDSSGTLTILGGSFGSLSSTITVGNGGGAATLNISNGTVTANQVNNALLGGSTGCAINLTGSTTGTFNNVQLGAGGNTSGPFTINTTGSVSLGGFIDYKDSTAVNTGTGLIIDNGPVTATSVIIQNTTSGGNMTINGGSLTVGTSSSTGAFLVGNSGSTRGGWLSMTGGALTYLGTDGLLMNVNTGSASGAFLYGGTATLTGITLDDGAATGANSTLTVSNGATLYLGSVGLVDSDPAPIANAVTFANGTVAAIAPWSSSVPVTLVSNAVIKAADSTGAAQGITLGGILSGSGGLTKTGAGTLTLSGANTYAGNTTNNAGTLAIGSGGSITSTNIVIATGAVLDTTGIGAGGLILGANQTLTSGHTSGSTTDINGDLTDGGTLNIAGTGVAGALVENGNLIFNSGSRVVFDLSATAGGANDQVTLNGGGNLTCGTIPVSINSVGTLDTSDYVLFSVAGGGSVLGNFYPIPGWLGTPPANANKYSVKTVGSTVVLHYFSGTLPSASSVIASPSPVVRNLDVTFSVTGVPGTGGSSISSVVIDLTAIGGSSSQALVNNGAGTFTNTVLVSPSSAVGVLPLPIIITDNLGTIGATNFSLTVNPSTETWNGSDAVNSYNWSDNANWVSGRAPGYTGDSLIFSGNQNAPVMDQAYSVPALTFNNLASGFTLTSSGSTLTLTGGVTNNSANLQTLNLPLALNGAVTVNASAGNVTEGMEISGTGSLTMTGAANAINMLSAANTFTGGANLNGGVVNLNATETPGMNGPLGVGGKIAFGGGILQYSGSDTADYSSRFSTNANQAFDIDTAGQSVTFASALISSGGSLTKIGVGTLTLNNAGSSFSGNITINGDTVIASVGAANTPTTTTLGAQSSARTITVNSGTTLTLSINNVFGNTPAVGIPRIVVNGGTLNTALFNSFGLSSNNTSGLTLMNGAVLGASGASPAPFFAGNLGDLVTVTGTSGSTISGGNQLDLWNGTRTGTGTNGATTFNVASTGAGPDLVVSTPLGNCGYTGTNLAAGLIKAGSGTMQLDAANTYTGGTVVSNGTLAGIGSIGGSVTVLATGNLGAGDVGPAVGTLTINSNLVLQSLATLRINKTGGSPQQPDQIAVGGNITYGGTLVVTNITSDSSALALGDTFQLFVDSGTVSGNFSHIAGSPGGLLDYSFSPASGVLSVVAATVPVAGFTGSPTNLFAGQSVTFSDASTGTITNWIWNFGDGVSVTNNSAASVNHTYSSVGAYTVSLMAKGPVGSNTSTRPGYIVVKPNPVIGEPVLAGNSLILSGSNGPAGQPYRILAATDLTLPLASWKPVYTNVFAADGTYGYTNTPTTNTASFFRLVSP